MTEDTLCNYCQYQNIRRRALKSKRSVTLIRNKTATYPLAVDIYVSPNDVVNPQAFDEKYHAVWFMSLPNICRC